MRTLYDLLEESAKHGAERPAVEDPEGGKDLSYGELLHFAQIMGGFLGAEGIRAGDRVALCAEKSASSVAAIFSILGAGAAYVPLDPDSPAGRNAGIVRDVVAAGLLADENASSQLKELLGWSGKAVPGNIFGGWTLLKPPARPSAGDPEISYILYTSGSTGEPKGVVHTHASALAFIDWCSEIFRPGTSDRVLSVAPFHFDLSIFDLFVSLKHGARIVLAGNEAQFHPQNLVDLATERGVTIWYSTPTTFRMVLKHGQASQATRPPLRLALFAGEVFDPADLDALRSVWKKARCYNLYGPTETNVCTYYDATDHTAEEGPIPIGKVCPFDQARLTEEGEILVTGASVMHGYWARPERTSESFWKDPEGVAWYRTGDFAQDRGDGQWIFDGRRDRRVKRRGHRVELDAIEAALREHPSVAEAAVVAFPDPESGVRLRAHMSWSSGAPPTAADIRNFCAKRIPSYMVPDSFSFDGPLPKLASGKIDYRGLEKK